MHRVRESVLQLVSTSPRFGLSVGAVERPKSPETREEFGSKGRSGVGMEAGAAEAVHKYQGGQTRPVPTGAHCGYSEEN